MIRVKKISIKQFGIIKDFKLELGKQSVTVILGRNESGKTTILDAILGALFSFQNLKGHFSGINRYTGSRGIEKSRAADSMDIDTVFDGFVEIEQEKNKVVFPQDKSFAALFSIPEIYARNMFVVRDGVTDFCGRDNWWNNVKNRLSGFSGNHAKIVQNIKDRVGLVQEGKQDDLPYESIDDRYEALNAKLDEIKAANDAVKELPGLETQNEEFGVRLKRCQKKLQEQEIAKKNFLFVEGKKLVNQYNEVQAQAIKFQRFKGDELKIWRNTETEIIKARQIIELSKKHMGEFSSYTSKNIKDADNWKKRIDEWQELEIKVVPTLESQLADYRRNETKHQRGGMESKGGPPVWVILSAASTAAILFVSVAITPVFYPLAGILFIAMGYSIKTWWASRNAGTHLETLERSIKDAFKLVSPEEMDVEGINNWLVENRNQIYELRKRIRLRKEDELPDIESTNKELSSSINTLESKLQKLCNFTKAIQISTKCSSWEELQDRCNKKETLRASLNMLSDQINQLLNTKFEEEWEERLSELKTQKTINVEWKERLVNQLTELQDKLNTQISESNERIADIKINIAKFRCDNIEDFCIKEDETVAELNTIKIDKEAALLASEVVESVSHEQDNLVNDVISTGNESASNIFSAITGKRYNEVFLNKNNVFVKTNDGEVVSIDHLSYGTRVQLYFSIRVSLAQNLLHGEPAFLLLDDPFLVCDDFRKEEMVKTLHEISKAGWQFIYFTIDEKMAKMFEVCFKDKVKVYKLDEKS